MPTYEYFCEDCGDFSALRPMSARNEPCACPHCGAEAYRVMLSAPTRVRQLRSQVLVFARARFQKCHYNSASCSGAAGFSIPNA